MIGRKSANIFLCSDQVARIRYHIRGQDLWPSCEVPARVIDRIEPANTLDCLVDRVAEQRGTRANIPSERKMRSGSNCLEILPEVDWFDTDVIKSPFLAPCYHLTTSSRCDDCCSYAQLCISQHAGRRLMRETQHIHHPCYSFSS